MYLQYHLLEKAAGKRRRKVGGGTEGGRKGERVEGLNQVTYYSRL